MNTTVNKATRNKVKSLLLRIPLRLLFFRRLNFRDHYQPGDVYLDDYGWKEIKNANEYPSGMLIMNNLCYRLRFKCTMMPSFVEVRKKQKDNEAI